MKQKFWLALVAVTSTIAFSSYLHNSFTEPSVAHPAGQPQADRPADASKPAHSHGEMQHGDHQHGKLEIPAGQPVPSVRLVVHPDAVKGVNLEMVVTNFTFAPDRVNQKSLTTEGHVHLFVNGRKVTRLYGPWYYLGELPPGRHTVTVVLSANGHEDISHNGQPISATQVVNIPAGPTKR